MHQISHSYHEKKIIVFTVALHTFSKILNFKRIDVRLTHVGIFLSDKFDFIGFIFKNIFEFNMVHRAKNKINKK